MSLDVKITKRFDGFTLRTEFTAGNTTAAILGASGCGKSMTLRCIAGIVRPDSGRIVLDGETLFDSEQRIDLPPQRRRVGYLFQNYALFPNMTVEKNILCGLHREKDKARRAAELERVVELLQLRGLERLRPHQLSGGQAQRTALARILVSSPRLLMLDEPFSALDSHLRGRLQTELKALLRQFGGDVLMVTHSRDEAYHLCGQIAVMDSGRLLAVKDTKALFAAPDSVAAARLTGCKNISPARKTGEYEVEATDWGVRFTTAQPVRDGLKAVGIRAHYFNTRAGQNSHPVRYVDEMEEPFEWIVQFRYEGQPAGTEPLWWRIPKDRRPQTFPEALGTAPVNVLLLYE